MKVVTAFQNPTPLSSSRYDVGSTVPGLDPYTGHTEVAMSKSL